MNVTRKGSTILPAAMGILGSIMVIGFATSTRSAATNRYLDAARARRLLSVASRSVSSEASFVLEEVLGPLVKKGKMKERSEKLHQGGKPHTVEVPLTRAQFAGQRVTIGPVTAVFTPLKRHWDRKKEGGKKQQGAFHMLFQERGQEDDTSEEFGPQGGGIPKEEPENPEDVPPSDQDADKEEAAFKPRKEGDEFDADQGEEREGGDPAERGDARGGGQGGGEQASGQGGGGESGGANGGGGGGEGGKKGGKGKWRRRGYWGLVQLKFDVAVETQGHPLKKRIAIRRYVMVRKWGWHPLRVDALDVARSQEAVNP